LIVDAPHLLDSGGVKPEQLEDRRNESLFLKLVQRLSNDDDFMIAAAAFRFFRQISTYSKITAALLISSLPDTPTTTPILAGKSSSHKTLLYHQKCRRKA
jgi:hypothetical protein